MMIFDELASKETIRKTIESLKGRNIHAELVVSKEEAFKRIINLLPMGTKVMTASSITLEQIGFTELLKSGKHPWKT